MTLMSDKIKISIWPFVVISLVILVAVGIGFTINNSRTSQKIEKVTNQIEKIRDAHSSEFVEIARLTDIVKSSNLLDKINAPEQGIYNIYVLRKISDGYNLYKGSYPYYNYNNVWDYDVPLNKEQVDKLNKILNPEKTITSSESIFDNLWWDKDNLYAFAPIKENEKVIGYVVLKVGKSTNID